jgi:uncharacterized membrane protein (UPF0136 family)
METSTAVPSRCKRCLVRLSAARTRERWGGDTSRILDLETGVNSGSLGAVHKYANMILWVYIALLLAGGLFGFFRAKSKVSLVSAAVSAALLSLTAIPGILQPAFARGMAIVIMAALIVVFAFRLAKTRKFMPSGLMLILTTVALTLRSLVS